MSYSLSLFFESNLLLSEHLTLVKYTHYRFSLVTLEIKQFDSENDYFNHAQWLEYGGEDNSSKLYLGEAAVSQLQVTWKNSASCRGNRLVCKVLNTHLLVSEKM